MNPNIIAATLGAVALIGAVMWLTRTPQVAQETNVVLSAEQTGGVESGGCPISSTGQCEADGGHQTPTASTGSTATVSESVGDHDFTLEKLGGGTITLAEYRGQKPVIVDFWASWCPNCRRDMPKVNGWYQQYRDQVEVIGVNLQESPKTVQQFVDSNDIVFPIAFDPAGVASAQFGIQFTNTHLLFNKTGELVRVIPGDITEADIVSLIES
ncbi:MAG: TlpA disulfide reductase family protein [Candidatus Andersenbacteria bacterium]